MYEKLEESMTDIISGISMMKLLPIIPTKEKIKDQLKLRFSRACNKHFWKELNEYGINEFVLVIIEIVKDIITGEICIYSTYKEAVESIGGSKAGVREAAQENTMYSPSLERLCLSGVNKKGIYKGRWEINKII